MNYIMSPCKGGYSPGIAGDYLPAERRHGLEVRVDVAGPQALQQTGILTLAQHPKHHDFLGPALEVVGAVHLHQPPPARPLPARRPHGAQPQLAGSLRDEDN